MAVNSCGHESTRGLTLLRGDADVGPFVEIGAIEVMPELSPTAETAECTDPYGAAGDAWEKSYKTGKFTGGDPTFTVNWISGNATHDQLEADFAADTEVFFRIAYADANATTRTYPALVTGLSFPVPPNGGKAQITVTTKVNGEIIKATT